MHPCIVVAATEITTTFTTMASTNSSSTSSIQTMSDNKTVLDSNKIPDGKYDKYTIICKSFIVNFFISSKMTNKKFFTSNTIYMECIYMNKNIVTRKFPTN